MTEKRALYQKYRPNKLSQIVGQPHVVQTLTNAVKNGRLKHSYLFCGIRGSGKTSLARILALIMNCDNAPSVDYDVSDGICKSIISGTCPDVMELDAASNSSIDEIRELRKLARSNPVVGKKRIFIIDECLPFDSMITLHNGKKVKIGDIINSDEDFFVLSYNFNKKIIEEKKVIRKITIFNNKKMLSIKYKKNDIIKELKITSNHSVYLEDGTKIKAGDLKIGQKLNIQKTLEKNI